MKITIFELKKVLYYNKGLLFIILFFVIKIFSLILMDTPANLEMQTEEASYQYYLDKVQGGMTEEKISFFKEEAYELAQAKSEVQIINNLYYDGKLSREEYNNQFEVLKNKLILSKGFDVVYEQYLYAMENTDNRYLLSSNGWNGLLANETLNWSLYILLFLLIAPIFCDEIGSNMTIILYTQNNGGRNIAKYKIIIAVTIGVVLSVVNSIIDYSFYKMKYSLDHGTYPLQSLSYFGSSTKNISLAEGFFTIHGIKVLGVICLTIFILFFSIYLKNYSLVLLINTTFILLPFYTFSLQSFKYLIPGPLGLLLGTGFLRGGVYNITGFMNEKKYIFSEISSLHIVAVIGISILICVIMIYCILKNYTNLLYKSRGSK